MNKPKRFHLDLTKKGYCMPKAKAKKSTKKKLSGGQEMMKRIGKKFREEVLPKMVPGGGTIKKAKGLVSAQIARREVTRKAAVEKAVRRVKNRAAEGKVLTKGGAGAARIKRAEAGNRATTGAKKLTPTQEAAKKKLGDEFSPAAIAERSRLAKQARQTKEAAKKLTAKRKKFAAKNK